MEESEHFHNLLVEVYSLHLAVYYKSRFFYLFLAVLILHCCMPATLYCSARLSHAEASPVAKHKLRGVQASLVTNCGLSSCDAWV